MSLYVLHETCNEKEPCTQYRATSTFARARIMLKVGGSSTVYGDIFRYTHFSVFAGTPKLTKNGSVLVGANTFYGACPGAHSFTCKYSGQTETR